MRYVAFGVVVLVFIVAACTGGGPSPTPTTDRRTPPAFLLEWGSNGSGEGQNDFPRGVAVDPQGNVYVVDLGNYRIQKFTADGAFLTQWGSEGGGEGQFNAPVGVAVDGQGNVYVAEKMDIDADSGNDRIQKFGVPVPG